MDFSKLDQNEKLAIYGSAAVFLAGLISNWGGLLFISILAAVGMAVVVFLPQFSPGTTLPGSKGTLMAILGLVAAVGAAITALQWFSILGALLGSFNTIMFLVAVVGSIVMAWAGWQELQKEGGKWQFGASTTARDTGIAGTTSAAVATGSGTEAPPPPAAPPPAAPPAGEPDEERRTDF